MISRRAPRRTTSKRGPLRVLFLGDSITLGLWTAGPTGFRKPFYDHCRANGVAIDCVGTLDNGTGWPETQHEGVAGASIATLRTKFEANYGPGKISGVDLTFIMIGTNNMGMGEAYDNSTTPNQYSLFVAKVKELLPRTRLVVTPIIPLNPAVYAAEDTNRASFNTAIQTVWLFYDLALPNEPVIRWDAAAALGGAWSATYYQDDAHPNQAGFDLLSAAMIAAVDPVLGTL